VAFECFSRCVQAVLRQMERERVDCVAFVRPHLYGATRKVCQCLLAIGQVIQGQWVSHVRSGVLAG